MERKQFESEADFQAYKEKVITIRAEIEKELAHAFLEVYPQKMRSSQTAEDRREAIRELGQTLKKCSHQRLECLRYDLIKNKAEFDFLASAPSDITELEPYFISVLNEEYKDISLAEFYHQCYTDDWQPIEGSPFADVIAAAEALYTTADPAQTKKTRELLDSLKENIEKDTKQAQQLKELAESKNFYNVPSSAAVNLIYDVLSAGQNINNLPNRKKAITHSANVRVLSKNQKRRVQLNSGKSQIILELSDIDKVMKSNKAAKKMFILSLIETNAQAMYNGNLTKSHITFPLKKLVDIGFYKTPQSARQGFKNGMDTLTSFKVKGKLQKYKTTKGKEQAAEIEALRVLFTGYDIVQGQCTVYLNSEIDWRFLAQYFTLMPMYYFSLSNRASDLLYYIFYLARQNTKDIKKRGYFTIGFRSLQAKLNLPSESGNREPAKTIKQPIEDAIEELETAHSAKFNNTEFALLPVYDDAAPIKDFLDNGYLKITLSGEFAKTFIELSQKQEKLIETAAKRQEKIEAEAKTRAIQGQIEKEHFTLQ